MYISAKKLGIFVEFIVECAGRYTQLILEVAYYSVIYSSYGLLRNLETIFRNEYCLCRMEVTKLFRSCVHPQLVNLVWLVILLKHSFYSLDEFMPFNFQVCEYIIVFMV
jgi:hypothetical protein